MNGNDEIPDDFQLVSEDDKAQALKIKGEANRAFSVRCVLPYRSSEMSSFD